MLRELAATPLAQWHHANLRFPWWLDRGLRRVIVTPAMHRLHHSGTQCETDSNYGALLSCWDRLFGTYREAASARPVDFGLPRLPRRYHETLLGILQSPWAIGRERRVF